MRFENDLRGGASKKNASRKVGIFFLTFFGREVYPDDT